MVTTEPASDDRLPTMGPHPVSYEQYQFETTTEGDGRISDAESDGETWVQSSWTVSLEAWQ